LYVLRLVEPITRGKREIIRPHLPQFGLARSSPAKHALYRLEDARWIFGGGHRISVFVQSYVPGFEKLWELAAVTERIETTGTADENILTQIRAHFPWSISGIF